MAINRKTCGVVVLAIIKITFAENYHKNSTRILLFVDINSKMKIENTGD